MSSGSKHFAFALLLVGACANRTDAQVKKAWENRGGTVDPSVEPKTEDGGLGNSGRPGRGPKRVNNLRGWDRVANMVTRATFVMARSPEPEVLAHLAQRWCKVEPEAQETDDGWVRVCEPVQEVSIDGHAFTLEVGAVGVIGLVASDLSQPDSNVLLQQALHETKKLCARPFEEIQSLEFHTCPTEGGSTLAVGRMGKGKTTDGWQVSITVLGAS